MATPEVEAEVEGPTTAEVKSFELGLFDIRREYLRRENEIRYTHKRHATERESSIGHYYSSILRDTSDTLLREPSELRSRISKLQEELSIERATNQYLRFALVDAGKEISELEIDVRRARASLPLTAELSSTSEETEKTLSQLKRKIDRMRVSMLEQDAALTKATKDREDYANRYNDLAKLLDASEQAKHKAESAVRDVERRLTRRVEELEEKLKAKLDQCNAKDRELEKLQGMADQLESKSDELKAVQRTADHTRAELEEYRKKYDALTEKLQGELRQERAKSLDLEAKLRAATAQAEREKAKVAEEQKLRKEAADKQAKAKADTEALYKKCDELTLEVARLEKTVRLYERHK